LNNWLETHLWHAKRFKMKKLFGFSIPYRRMDKSFKACYRFSKYDSCVHDTSYFQYLYIECDDVVEKFIYIIKRISIAFSANNITIFSSHKVDVYDKGILIGPVRFILLKNFILIMYHPLMKNELNGLFEELDITFKNISKGINNFSIIGERSGSRIYKILQSLNFDGNQYFRNEEDFERLIHYMNDKELLLFKIDWPNVNFKMNEFILNNFLIKTLSDDIKMINSCSISELNNSTFDDLKIKSYFENINTEEEHIEIPTESIIFTHRKKDNINNLHEKIQ